MIPTTLRSVFLFVFAGLLEIGGGYLVWQWIRHGHSVTRGMVGMVLLAGYGIVATYQPADFSRVYAAYGGIFIALSLVWGWALDGRRPDVPDVAGAMLCVAGAAIIMYWPRT
ncbi:MAG: rane protein ynfA [Gemmatimonadetes bacterium]|jgi:small multidrug resistance family-3 protein|nr:rane protein ynfA [Gemmatimonadota bacterium]